MPEPRRFRKKPVVIEAVQVKWTSYEDACAIAEWCGGEAWLPGPSGNGYAPGLIFIETLEGKMWAKADDWIIRGVQGEFYPCKPDIFAATYEAAQEQPASAEEALLTVAYKGATYPATFWGSDCLACEGNTTPDSSTCDSCRRTDTISLFAVAPTAEPQG